MRLKKFLIYFFLILGLLVGSVFAIGKFYSQQVKDVVVAKLNEHLTAKVKVGEVDLTLFDNFPQAAIRFDKVCIADKLSPNGRDTMLFAEKMYLSFNFWDIWNKNYKITELSVHGGMFHLAFNEKGESNFDIWKSDTTVKGPSNFQIALNHVGFEDIFLRYNEPTNQQDLRCFIKSATFSGNLSDESYDLETAISARMYAYRISGVTYIEEKNVGIETALQINNRKQQIGFRGVQLGINQLQLKLDGTVNYGDQAGIDLKILGERIKIIDLMASLPKFSTQELERYRADGTLDIKSRLKGKLGNGYLPGYTATFSIGHGEIEEKKSTVTLKNIDLSGYYFSDFSGTKDSLSLKRFSGSFHSGSFSLEGSVVNFSEPLVHGKILGKVDLQQLTSFLGANPNDTIRGVLDLNATIHGVLAKNDTSTHQVWNKLNTEGEMTLNQGHFKLRGAKNPLEQVKGKLKLTQNVAVVDQLSFVCGSSDFSLTGVIHNLVPYLFKTDETVSIAADLNSKNIDLADFIAAKEKAGDDFRLAFPKDISGYLTTKISNLKYHRFSAQALSGKLVLNHDGLSAENLNLKAFNGQLSGAISLKREGKDYVLQNQTRLSRVELDKLFYQLENLGQTMITDKNIKGKADAQVELFAKLNAALEFDQQSILSTAKIKVIDGQLNNLEVFKDLAAYLKTNGAIALMVNVDKLGERLKQVNFATLENTITIKDRKLILPDMNIKSSALDMNINGTHSFDNKIDYGLNFRMAEVFQKDKVTDNGYIVDDDTGMRMFISIGGTTDNPVFKYDKLSAAQARKEKFEQEKTTFKSILKQEFGLFKSDTTLKQVKAADKGKVRFELESASAPANQSSQKTNATKPQSLAPTKKPAPKKQESDNKDYNLDDDI